MEKRTKWRCGFQGAVSYKTDSIGRETLRGYETIVFLLVQFRKNTKVQFNVVGYTYIIYERT